MSTEAAEAGVRALKVPTAALSDRALDYAVGLAERLSLVFAGGNVLVTGALVPGGVPAAATGCAACHPSTTLLGDRILVREGIRPVRSLGGRSWSARFAVPRPCRLDAASVFEQHGASAREAGLRCYVAGTIGDEVEIPAALLHWPPCSAALTSGGRAPWQALQAAG